MRYLKTFAVSAPLFTVLYHAATAGGPNPMAWWPDACIMGGAMGLLASFALLRPTPYIAARRFFRALFAKVTELIDRRD